MFVSGRLIITNTFGPAAVGFKSLFDFILILAMRQWSAVDKHWKLAARNPRRRIDEILFGCGHGEMCGKGKGTRAMQSKKAF